jgi:ACR3 family arsenite efflux pump ArsB
MSAQCEVTAKRSAGEQLGIFERYLTLWVALRIVAGITLGHFLPGVFQTVGALEVAEVNLPVAVLIWLMIVPMLLKIDFAALHRVREHRRGVGVTLFVNWAVKPFSMALLAWIFIRHVFAPYLPAEQLDSFVAGLIILAAAPCTAMVFVWSNLSDGEPHFTLQGEQILKSPLIIVMLAVPILIQVYFNSGLAYLLNRQVGEAHCVAAPSALIGASNFFELAVAAAISLFGFDSGAALATVVGVLVEVPVMLSVVRIVNRTKAWYERRAART